MYWDGRAGGLRVGHTGLRRCGFELIDATAYLLNLYDCLLEISQILTAALVSFDEPREPVQVPEHLR